MNDQDSRDTGGYRPVTNADSYTGIMVTLARQDEKLSLLPEMRNDLKSLREDMTALKTKAAMVAAAVSGIVALIGHYLTGK